MNNILKKMILSVLAAALVFAAFPATSVFAQGPNPPVGPRPELTNERLEKIWARQLRIYGRIDMAYTNTDRRLAMAQGLIDKASANGKDVTAVQAALDAFKSALNDTKPIYESMKGIVNSHLGFDAKGKVTDFDKAKSTVEAMRAKFKEARASMNGTGRAFIQAIRAFREANK